MKKIFFCVLTALFFIAPSTEVKATHASGADISYQCISGNNNFDVVVNFYRACSGIGAPPTVTVNVSSASCGQNFNVTAFLTGPGVEIIPYCPAFLPTQCGGGPAANNARELYSYTASVLLPQTCSDWVFSYTICCRNGGAPPDGITNIFSPGAENIYVEAKLDNSAFPCNSSPFFTNPPAPFVYTGATVCYNNGAVDLDGDSLYYTLITPRTGPLAGNQVTYNAPFSNTQPLSSAPAVTMDPTTGDVCMTPTVVGEVTVMAILVEEYRFGTLIGSVIRDIQVNVIPGVDNLPTTDGINSGGLYTDTIAAGCPYSFTTNLTDIDGGDCLTLSSNVAVAIPGASFTSSGGCTPTGTFNWTPGVGDVRSTPHVFVTTGLDDACPVNGSEIRAWQLTVIEFSADFTTSAPACVQENVNFFSQYNYTGYNYLWDFGVSAITNFSQTTKVNPDTVRYATSGTKTVTLTITSPTGCSVTMTKLITINNPPVATFTNSVGTVCEGETIAFTNTGSTGVGVTYMWNFGLGSSPSSSTLENPSGISWSTSGTKTVTFTITNQFGCITTTTGTVVINPTPIADFSSTAPSCTGDSVNFANTGTTGVTYLWSFDTGATPATSTVENPLGIIYSTAGIKTVSLITTSGTCADTNTQTININLTPVVSFTSNLPVCVGEGANFTNTGSTSGNWTYDWDFGIGATPNTSFAENPLGVIYDNGGSKAITLTITDGVCTNSFTGSVTINSLPTVDAGLDTTICADLTVQIGSSTIVGYTYSWFPSNSLVINNPFISDPIASPIAAITIYTVSVTETATGCQNIDSMIVTMVAATLVDAGPDLEICYGDIQQIGSAQIEGQAYSWTPSLGLDSANVPSPMASPDSTTIYTVSVTYENCAAITDDVLVLVHPLPNAKATDILGNDTTVITLGSSVQLIATGGILYDWTPPTDLDFAGIFNPMASPGATTMYMVNVTDLFGCVNSDSVMVKVNELSFFIPTAFTPDGNGISDIFYVRIEEVENFELLIFNRWGQQIFVSRDVLNGWDGNNQNSGKQLPQGAYVYSFKGTTANGKEITDNGIINLIR